jgi:CRISPR-associated protein (TIGR03984 family)
MDGFDKKGPINWLSQQMCVRNLKYLLAHADDGVIWGRLDGEELITSHDVASDYSPPLRAETLQMARVFGLDGEILVWRDESGAWVGRFIAETTLPDATARWIAAFEETHILLGTKAESQKRDFSLLSEGSQGLFHVVPLNLPKHIDEQSRPLRLIVRHYVTADDHGFVRVDASRLVNLAFEAKGE